MLFMHTANHDGDTEFVLVGLHLEEPTRDSLDPKLNAMYARGGQDFPLRLSAVHHCIYDKSSTLVQLFLKVNSMAMELVTRARVKVHQGA